MLTIFRHQEKKTLYSGQVLLSEGRTDIAWKLKRRGNQHIHAEEDHGAFGGDGGLVLQIDSGFADRQFSYLRGSFAIDAEDCDGIAEITLDLDLLKAPGLLVIAALYDDPEFTHEIASLTLDTVDGDGPQTCRTSVNFREIGIRHRPVYGFIQLCLTVPFGARIAVGAYRVEQAIPNPNYRKLRVRYDYFGDVKKASSRLRVWRFAELLREEGHEVVLDGSSVDVDVFVCQKNRPFATAAAVRKANPQAVIVYDFDDNFLLPSEGVVPDLVAFLNHCDVVSCGSGHLRDLSQRWHSNCYLFDNMLDVSSDSLCRASTGTMKRIGWFGSPENLPELRKIDPRREVLTLTKGGDMEFDIETVDRDLMTFDLLLFPVEPTEWNLGKNANRMSKALALGIPVLCNATPEQARIAAMAGVHPHCVVPDLNGWAEAIDRIEADYAEVERMTLEARTTMHTLFSQRAVVKAFFEHIAATTRLGQFVPQRELPSFPELGKVDVLVVDGSAQSHVTATFGRSDIDWSAFHRVTALSTAILTNDFLRFAGTSVEAVRDGFPGVFARADAIVANSKAEYLLIVPSGVALAHGAARMIAEFVRRNDRPMMLFSRTAYASNQLIGNIGASPVQDLLDNMAAVGPLLVRTDWVRTLKVRWNQAFEYWTWVVALKALTAHVPATFAELPFAYEASQREERDVPRQFSVWLQETRPSAAAQLPDIRKQWERMLTDIVADAVSDADADLPAAFSTLFSRHMAANRRIALLERENKALKAKK